MLRVPDGKIKIILDLALQMVGENNYLYRVERMDAGTELVHFLNYLNIYACNEKGYIENLK